MARSALALLAIAGVAYLGLVILVLSLLTSQYSPVTQVASDYGVGPYAAAMNLGFFVSGLGAISLALATYGSGSSGTRRAGAALLVPAGLALMTNGFFQTDIEGAATTMHGVIHSLGGVVFFLASPVGLLLVSGATGGRRFTVTLLAFAVGAALLALNGALGLNAAGLAERVMILFVFGSYIAGAADVYSKA